MTAFLLFCVLIAQLITIAVVWKTRLTDDFSNEDEQVKEATEEIHDAQNNLPPTEQ